MKKIFTRKTLSLILTALLFITLTAGAALVIDAGAVGEEAVWGTNTEYNTGTGTLAQAMIYANGYTSGTAYIRLLKDVNTTAPLEVNTGRNVDLDLAGYKIDRGLSAPWNNGNGNVITVSGSLTLNDSGAGKTGMITGGYNNSYGGGIFVSGTLTMKGGTILNNRSQTNGGGIYATQAGKVYIEGGTIKLNSSMGKGGGICADGSCEIKGGEIMYNTASNSPGGVYYGIELILSGNPKITNNVVGGTLSSLILTGGTPSNLYITSKSLTIASVGLSAGAEIGVGASTTPTSTTSYGVTGINNANYSSYFRSDNSRYIVENIVSGSNYVVAIGLQEAVWGLDSSYGAGGGTLAEGMAYVAGLPAGSVAYVLLQKDVTLAAAIEAPATRTVRLDLGGRTLKRSLSSQSANGYVVAVYGSLILEDTATGGKITGGNNTGNGGGICVFSGGTLQINGGSITNNRASYGGGIYLSDNATLVVNSANITNNVADMNGGGIYISVATASISTAPVISGNSAGLGGGIYLMSDGNLDFGGTVRNNVASINGGGIYAGGNLKVAYAAYVYENTKSFSANNIYLPTGKRVTINLSTGLYGTARMGITTEIAPTSVTPIQIINAVNSNYSGYFTSDNMYYGLKNTGTGSDQVLMLSAQSVAVGELTGGTLTRRTSASGLTIPVVTTNISNGTAATVTWYRDASKTQYGDSYRPSGVTVTASAVNNNSVTLTVNSGSSASAGDYYFTVKIDGIESDIKILKVGKTKLSVPAVTTLYYYTGYEQTVSIAGFDSGTMAVVSGNKQTSVGIDYRIIIRLIDPTQYEWVNGSTDNQSIYWSIYRAMLQKPTAAGTNAYKGVEQNAALNNFNASAMVITGNDKQKNVGTYTLVVSIKDLSSYEWADHTTNNITIEWKITKAPLTVKANDASIVYGDAAPIYSVTYSGLVGGETSSVLSGNLSLSCTYSRYANAGNYQIVPNGLSSASYDITFLPGNLTVSKKTVTVAWSNTEFTYDGKTHQPTTELLNYTGAGRVSVSGAMVNAGSYKAEATGFVDINYSLTNTSVSFSISKVPLTIKANDLAIVYGEIPAGNGVSYNGFVNGEGGGVLSGTLVFDFDYKQYGDVGASYKVTPSGLSSINYTITYVAGTLTVNKATVAVAIDDVSSISGAEALTYKITGGAFVNGDEKYLKLTRDAGDIPGVYGITGSLESSNYNCTITPGKYTILQTAVSSSGKSYGVTMTSSGGLNPGYKLTVLEVDKKSVSKQVHDGKVLAAYDISLTSDLVKVQPDGRVTIKIPDVGFEKYEILAVVHLDSSGKAEQLYTVREGGYLTITVDSLSTFAVVSLDVNYTWAWITAIAVVVLLGGGLCVYLFGFKKKAD